MIEIIDIILQTTDVILTEWLNLFEVFNPITVLLWTIILILTLVLSCQITKTIVLSLITPFYERVLQVVGYCYSAIITNGLNSIKMRCYSYLWFKLSTVKKQDYRGVFKAVNFSIQPHTNHTHPMARAEREAAHRFIDVLAQRIGRTSYNHSMNLCAQNAVSAGTRMYFHAKDFSMDYQLDKFEENSNLFKMIDVDYYVDMPSIMDGRYICFYSFEPKKICGQTHDGVYYVLPDGRIETHVNGGAKYTHDLWDYEHDHIVVDHWWGASLYLMEKRQISEDRVIIFMNPIRNVYSWFAWLIPGDRLGKRSLTKDNLAYSAYFKKEQNHVTKWFSFARYFDTDCVNIPSSVLTAASIRFNSSKDPAISDLERIFKSYGVVDVVLQSCLFHWISKNSNLIDYVKPISVTDLKGYQTLYPLVTEDPKQAMRHVGFAMSEEGVAPGRSYNNDCATVGYRIEDQRNVAVIPNDFITYRTEFMDCVLSTHVDGKITKIDRKNFGKGVPYEFEFMLEKMKRSTQRSLISRCRNFMFDVTWKVASFMKAEAYCKFASPRNISTLPMSHNLRMGQFIHSFSNNILQHTHWYAFKIHPKVLAERIMIKCQPQLPIISEDFSRMDATHNEYTIQASDFLLRAYFGDVKDLRDIQRNDKIRVINSLEDELMQMQLLENFTKGYTKFGVEYVINYINNTGSSATTLHNTIPNALKSYIALRMSGKSIIQAYNNLGVYGGDDSLDFNIDTKVLEKVSTKMGLKLKCETHLPGKSVPFLGRIFVNPWETMECIADVRRTISKLHLSSSPTSVPDFIALRRKAKGILITDSKTPLLRDWAEAILRVFKDNVSTTKLEQKFEEQLFDRSYWQKFDTPFVTPRYEETYSVVAENLGITEGDLLSYIDKLQKVNTFDDLDMEKLIQESPKSEMSVAHRGTIIPGKDNQICRYNERLQQCRRTNCMFEHPNKVVTTQPVIKIPHKSGAGRLSKPVDKTRRISSKV
jgi:hypothetical protein